MSALEVSTRPDFDDAVDRDIEVLFDGEGPEDGWSAEAAVHNLQAAIVAMDRLRSAQGAIAEVDEAVDARLRELQAWANEVKRPHERRMAYLTGLLEEYGRRAGKTVKLPGGVIDHRKQPAEFQRDDAQVLDYVKEAGHPFVKVVPATEGLNWAGLKAWATAKGDALYTPDGERIPGVTVVAREPAVTVKANPA
ncbi:MAG: host-nuclease inhibitor Gam family protein [Candidatus Dormibacteraeota bacterium]|nr:host-nuclease inhibitor Gam family protein [Candidatus Dormibacteraeota bacterium]